MGRTQRRAVPDECAMTDAFVVARPACRTRRRPGSPYTEYSTLPDHAVPNQASGDSSVDDPRPTPPIQPELEDCCNSGCSPCVFDLYDEALARYRVELAEWEARQAQREPHR